MYDQFVFSKDYCIRFFSAKKLTSYCIVLATACYVVMVNTAHPAIHQQLQDVVESAEAAYEKGRFSMDVCLISDPYYNLCFC